MDKERLVVLAVVVALMVMIVVGLQLNLVLAEELPEEEPLQVVEVVGMDMVIEQLTMIRAVVVALFVMELLNWGWRLIVR